MAERQRPSKERDALVWRSGSIHFIAEGIARNRVPEIYVDGLENLEILRRLRESKIPTIIIANHLSNSDTPVITSALHREGYSDIADDTAWILGTKLTDKMLTRFLSRGYHYIPIAKAPKDNDKRFSMLRSAAETAKKVSDRGMTLGLFPESGRSRNKQLIKAEPATAFYLKVKENMHVVPVAVWGTENVLDVGQTMPRKASANVRVGEPFPAKEVISKYGKRADRQVIDDVMSIVAELLPEKYKGYYGQNVDIPSPSNLWEKSPVVS